MLGGAVGLFSGTPKGMFSQMDQGSITGQAVDAKTASIAHAAINLRKERTGEARTVESNDDGSYQVLALKPSFYTIRLDASGFATADMTRVHLGLGQRLHRNLTL